MDFPITANLDESLRVEIHLHQLYLGDRDRYCWTYLTRGMKTHQQPEMCLSLLVDDEGDVDDFPKMPIKMFQLLAERTRSGRTVTAGDSTRLGQTGIFGFPSLFYVPSIQYEGLPSVDNYLSLILIHQQEYDFARQYGLTRLLSRLGKFCSSFPYPTWNTPVRPSLFPPNTLEPGILSDPRQIENAVPAGHSYAHQLGSVLQLQLHQNDADQVQKALAVLQQGQAAVINTAFPLHCDAILYWQEGQELPGAYAAQEASTDMLGGSFVSLGFNQHAKLSIQKDGFSIAFTETDWDSLCNAVRNEQPYETEFPDGMRFVLDYVDVTARSVARPYEPGVVWKNLEQQATTTTSETAPLNVKAGAFDCLSGAASLTESVSLVELLAYIGRIESTLSGAMSEETDSFLLELDLKITPDEVSVRPLSNIDLNPDFDAFIVATIQRIKPCLVSARIQIMVPFYINQE